VDAHGADKLVVITIDASASGFGFVVGDPSMPSFAYSGAFTMAQSVNTSNWREGKAKVLALAILRRQLSSAVQGAFIVFRSDNTSAVSLVNKATSKSEALQVVANDIQRELSALNAQAASMHVAGVRNEVADKLSRRAELLFEQRIATHALVAWATVILAQQGFNLARLLDVQPPLTGSIPGGEASHRLRTQASASTQVALCVPPPSRVEACIKSSCNVKRLGFLPGLLIPLGPRDVAGVPHRWRPVLAKYKFTYVTASPPPGKGALPFKAFRPAVLPNPVSAVCNSPPLTLEVAPTLHLWWALGCTVLGRFTNFISSWLQPADSNSQHTHITLYVNPYVYFLHHKSAL
jgi:hypothetical protein